MAERGTPNALVEVRFLAVPPNFLQERKRSSHTPELSAIIKVMVEVQEDCRPNLRIAPVRHRRAFGIVSKQNRTSVRPRYVTALVCKPIVIGIVNYRKSRDPR